MKITITTQLLSQSIRDQANVRWGIQLRKIKGIFLLFGVLIVLLLVIGITTRNDYSLLNTGTQKIYFNLNLYTSLGIAGILVWLFLLRRIYQTRKLHLKANYEIAGKFEHIHEVTFEFNDTEIIIDRKLNYDKVHWSLFSETVYHDPFLFLNYSPNIMDGITIDRRFFSEAEFTEIRQLIVQKIH